MSDEANFGRLVPRYDPGVRISVIMDKPIRYELVVDGVAVRELTRVEIIELVMQAVSSLRY